MHHPPHHGSEAEHRPPTRDDGSALRLTPLAPTGGRRCFPLDHPYVEFVYLPLVGAGAVAFLRRVGSLFDDPTTSVEVDAATLASELGLRSASPDPVGERSPLMRIVARLNRQGLTTRMGPRHFGIYRAVPAVTPRELTRLPESAISAHEQFMERRPG